VAGAVIGGTLKLLLHIVVLGRERLRMYRLTLDLTDPHLRAFVLLVLPLLLGIDVSQWRDAVVRNAITSVAGLPTFYDMGRAVVDSIGFLIPLSLSIALLPYFCDLEARNDRAQLGRLLTQTIRMLVWFFVPLGIVLAAAALPTCLVLFRGRVIGAPQAVLAALVLQIFCIQLPFLATEMMLNQAFFSGRRMVAPTAVGIILSLVASGIAYVAVIQGRVTGATGILLVVCLTLVAMRIIKCFVLVALLKRTVPVLPLAETLAYGVRLLLAGGAAAAAALGMQQLYRGPLAPLDRVLKSGHISNALEAVLIGASGAAVYLAASYLLRMEEPRLCWHWAREKMRRRGQKLPAATVGPDDA
jgi:peptidoglycan biosynthesis protein MviN/MurJ (putative lipid II flippase)